MRVLTRRLVTEDTTDLSLLLQLFFILGGPDDARTQHDDLTGGSLRNRLDISSITSSSEDDHAQAS
jgi:hypothetical protein